MRKISIVNLDDYRSSQDSWTANTVPLVGRPLTEILAFAQRPIDPAVNPSGAAIRAAADKLRGNPAQSAARGTIEFIVFCALAVGVFAWMLTKGIAGEIALAVLAAITAASIVYWRAAATVAHRTALTIVPPEISVLSEAPSGQLPPCAAIILRSFRSDKTRIRFGGELLETALAHVLAVAGPVIAIGNPRRSFVPVGAQRIRASDVNWQTVVKELLSRCSVIAVVVGRSDGLDWEMRQVRTADHLGKTIYVMPPFENPKRPPPVGDLVPALVNIISEIIYSMKWDRNWRRFCAGMEPHIDAVQLASVRKSARPLAIAFPGGSHCLVIASKRCSETDYAAALAVVTYAILSSGVGLPSDPPPLT